ncbi:hypothetical protein GCM10009546_69750 [Actinomadura livida]|uniref:Secreted protein n=1 Tax=Actinomadura livida TaxID=79909 RepID=A0ABN1FTU9_9ACTN|nr:hypothetical protein GCM10010208_73460 [Actinomadura livida]
MQPPSERVLWWAWGRVRRWAWRRVRRWAWRLRKGSVRVSALNAASTASVSARRLWGAGSHGSRLLQRVRVLRGPERGPTTGSAGPPRAIYTALTRRPYSRPATLTLTPS